MFDNLKRCHIDTICLMIVFAIGTYIVHRKLQEDYKNFKSAGDAELHSEF